jgi:hypothetical protein
VPVRAGRLIGIRAFTCLGLVAAIACGQAAAHVGHVGHVGRVGRAGHAARAVTTVNVEKRLGGNIAYVRAEDHGIAVLLPTTLRLASPKKSASAVAHNGYRLELDYAEPCDGANVCLSAEFTAQRGTMKPYGKAVTLADGIHGAYADIQCGASCSPASVQWREHGVLYSIIATLGVELTAHPNKQAVTAAFVAAADQAITAGPR